MVTTESVNAHRRKVIQNYCKPQNVIVCGITRIYKQIYEPRIKIKIEKTIKIRKMLKEKDVNVAVQAQSVCINQTGFQLVANFRILDYHYYRIYRIVH